MAIRLHHVCIATKEFDRYLEFFGDVLHMTVQRTSGDAPARQLWFNEGIQIKEIGVTEEVSSAIDHISLGSDDIPGTVSKAVEWGCSPLPQGAHWFMLPNGVKIELKPY